MLAGSLQLLQPQISVLVAPCTYPSAQHGTSKRNNALLAPLAGSIFGRAKAVVAVLRKGPGYYNARIARTLYFPGPTELRFRLRSQMHMLGKLYILVHLAVIVLQGFGAIVLHLDLQASTMVFVYAATSLYIHGALLDGKPWAPWVETARTLACAAFVLALHRRLDSVDHPRPVYQRPEILAVNVMFYVLSAAFCVCETDKVRGASSLQLRK